MDLQELIRHMDAVLHPQTVVFCLATDVDVKRVPAICMFREQEGVTLILEEPDAVRLGLTSVFRAAWITLTVHSDLHAVGLTAAVSGALAAAGISCNVVAAVHHDHLFVPVADGEAALAALRQLQETACPDDSSLVRQSGKTHGGR